MLGEWIWRSEGNQESSESNQRTWRMTSSKPVPDVRLVQAARRIARENKGGDRRENLSNIAHSCPQNGLFKAPSAKRDRRFWRGKSALQSFPVFSLAVFHAACSSMSQIPGTGQLLAQNVDVSWQHIPECTCCVWIKSLESATEHSESSFGGQNIWYPDPWFATYSLARRTHLNFLFVLTLLNMF